MMDLRFHHIGVGTTRFEKTLATYQALGFELACSVDDVGLSVRIAFLTRPNHPLLEVVAPLGDDSPLKSMIRRKQLPSPYHTAYEVPDLAVAAAALRDQGFLPLHEPKPAMALDDRPIQYFYGAQVGMLELIEGPAPRFGT